MSLLSIALVLLCSFLPVLTISTVGSDAYDTGITLTQLNRDEEAAEYFWTAITRSTERPQGYDVRIAVEGFMGTYHRRGIPEEGLLRMARQFRSQGQEVTAIDYINTVLSIKPDSAEAYILLGSMTSLDPNVRLKHLISALQIDPDGYKTNFDVASQLWELRAWDSSLSYFERAFQLNSSAHVALSTAIYLRQYICKWGVDGMLHYADMRAIEQLAMEELYMLEDGFNETDIATVTPHPHMTLGYDIRPELKLEIARSHSRTETALVKESGATIHTHQPGLYREEAAKDGFRIKVGYVSANIKSKTTVYMAQDLFRFHNRSKYEVHVYAVTPNDSPQYIQSAMGGVDWRKKIRNSVEYFHDLSGWNVLQICNAIREDGIHILLNWDGFSNNGVRPTGLFPMRCAPLQVAHQEYISTMGADFIQYMIGDIIATPPRMQHLYSEKFIYLPHCFLANSMPYLSPEITPPTLSRPPSQDPKLNGCGGPPADFVFCNFNKHLKFRPDTFRSWLEILQAVDDSVLCLLENPADSIKYLMHFIESFDRSLLSRVRFQSFVANPFENQHRTRDMCHLVLDTPIYNSHTTAADALWGGVPIVVYGNGPHMAGRVGHSIMTTLEIPELIAHNQSHYVDIAIAISSNATKFQNIRRKLLDTIYANNPRNPFWDLQTYVKNLEIGYEMIWNNFLEGKNSQHMYVKPERSTFASEVYKEGVDAELMYITAFDRFPKAPGLSAAVGVNEPKLLDIHDFTGHMIGVLEELEQTVSKSITRNQKKIAAQKKEDAAYRSESEASSATASVSGAYGSSSNTLTPPEEYAPGLNSKSGNGSSESENGSGRTKDIDSSDDPGKMSSKKDRKSSSSSGADTEQCTSPPLTVHTSRGSKHKKQ